MSTDLLSSGHHDFWLSQLNSMLNIDKLVNGLIDGNLQLETVEKQVSYQLLSAVILLNKHKNYLSIQIT